MVLVGVFRTYLPAFATPLLGLAGALGLFGAILMWLGLTLRTKEELERLPEEAQQMETSTGLFEILLIIVIIAAALAIGGVLLLALL
ncbi:MAG: hypothetical protein DRJ98_00210 [Thermoprotei archaeon]|nr:MAG: hypothetical protein DRJ98_00210 [Thermoprotei archaeon]RLF18834.1 MAG: hypothetical protein DRN06_00445 [Thermoprotei archaeon]